MTEQDIIWWISLEITKNAKIRFADITDEIWKIKKKEENNSKTEDEDEYSEISEKYNESNIAESPEEPSL